MIVYKITRQGLLENETQKEWSVVSLTCNDEKWILSQVGVKTPLKILSHSFVSTQLKWQAFCARKTGTVEVAPRYMKMSIMQRVA